MQNARSADDRLYVCPPDVYARYEASGLVRYGRDEVLAARADLLAAQDVYDAVVQEAGAFLREQEEVVCGPAYPLRALAFDKYAPAYLRPLMEWEDPSQDFNGTSSNLYPLPKWTSMARTFRSRAAKLRKLLTQTRAAATQPAAVAA
jgi:hypothetical protein